MRLFVAVDLPMEAKKALNRISTGIPNVRWVTPDQLHITLRFIGDTDAGKFEAIDTALKKIAFKPFEMALVGVGQFPETGKPNVLWAGVDADAALESLAKDVEKAIIALGFEPERKAFTPHVTLARLKSPPNPEALKKFFTKNADFETDSFTISQFILYSSLLSPHGASYRHEAIYAAPRR